MLKVRNLYYGFPIEIFSINCRFPLNNPSLLQKWLLAMRREKWNPTKTAYICSQHFLASDYNYPPSLTQAVSLKRKYLKFDAVPSIFDFPDHLKKKPVKERNPKKREREVQHLSLDSNLPRAPKMAKLDHTYVTTNVPPRKLKKKCFETIK